MRILLRSVIALTALLVAATFGTVRAADMPIKAPSMPAPPPVWSWTGFYIGGNAGYAWGTANLDPSFTCAIFGLCPINDAANLANSNAIAGGSLSPSGFTGGGQLGYNWQTGNWVLGVETDFDALNLRDSRSASVPRTTLASIFSATTSISTGWMYTLRGRLGWTVAPTVLLYASGGLALADATLSNAFAITGLGATAGASSTSPTLTGWTVGGGLEWMVAQNWTVKAEYLYVDFGSISTTANVVGGGAAVPNVYSTSTDLKTNIVRAGVNYKF